MPFSTLATNLISTPGRGRLSSKGEASFSLLNLPRPGVEIKFVANVENGVSIPLKLAN